MSTLSRILLFSLLLPVQAWILLSPAARRSHLIFLQPRANCLISFSSRSRDEFLDAEFERVEDSIDGDKIETPESPTIQEPKHESSAQFRSKNLIDIALDSDPEISSIEIPFIEGNNYLPTRVSFSIELDGQTYAIGTPFESPVAIVTEDQEGNVQYIDPDEEENTELMEIMATQVKDHLGDEFSLKRTPRVLTVSGPLEEFTRNWRNEILPDSLSPKDLLNEDDEDVDSFLSFMRSELGDGEVDKVLSGGGDDIDEDLMALFDVPGLGTQTADTEGMETLLKSLNMTEEEIEDEVENELGGGLEHEGVALKLISYKLPKGKEYSLVKFMKPFTVVGKLVEQDDGDSIFQFLPKKEEERIIPQIEKICREDFERIGISLGGST